MTIDDVVTGATVATLAQRARKTAGKAKKRAAPRARRPGRRHHHSVYVVLLSRDVLYEAKFKRCNPGYQPGKPCVYVGMTGLTPDERFDKHKAGIRANRYVQRYGLALLPALYDCYNPMPYEAAKDMEIELAIGLREAGYGVWQA